MKANIRRIATVAIYPVCTGIAPRNVSRISANTGSHSEWHVVLAEWPSVINARWHTGRLRAAAGP
jgi:hypothetical protein